MLKGTVRVTVRIEIEGVGVHEQTRQNTAGNPGEYAMYASEGIAKTANETLQSVIAVHGKTPEGWTTSGNWS